MMEYIVESSLALLLFYGFYHFLLSKENCYRFNRYYLLWAVGLALILPLVHLRWYILPPEDLSWILELLASPTEKSEPPSEAAASFFSWDLLFKTVYLAGFLVMAFYFFRNLWKLFRKLSFGKTVVAADCRMVLLPNVTAPFSFLHYCFVDEAKYRSGKIEEALLMHELAHIRQRHSLDILFLEVVRLFYWFNPILRLYANAIRLNHEYLSDQAVLKNSEDEISYQQLLFKYIRAQQAIPLASPLNFSLTKKRFQMIQYHNAAIKNRWKQLLVIPMFLGAFLIFSVSLQAQTETAPPPPPPPLAPQSPTSQEVTPPPPPPPPVVYMERRMPALEDLKKWGNSSSYKVWLDGKILKAGEVAQLKPEGIGWYNVSALAKNAKDYGQYQFAVNVYSLEFYNKHLSKYQKKH
jgi:hypothetical protein